MVILVSFVEKCLKTIQFRFTDRIRACLLSPGYRQSRLSRSCAEPRSSVPDVYRNAVYQKYGTLIKDDFTSGIMTV